MSSAFQTQPSADGKFSHTYILAIKIMTNQLGFNLRSVLVAASGGGWRQKAAWTWHWFWAVLSSLLPPKAFKLLPSRLRGPPLQTGRYHTAFSSGLGGLAFSCLRRHFPRGKWQVCITSNKESEPRSHVTLWSDVDRNSLSLPRPHRRNFWWWHLGCALSKVS